MGGGDVHVNVDELKRFAERLRPLIDQHDDYARRSASGPMGEAYHDGSKFGGWPEAQSLRDRHNQALVEIRRLLGDVQAGLQSAKGGIETIREKYHSTDQQQRLRFDGIGEEE